MAIGKNGRQMAAHDSRQLLTLRLVPQIDLIGASLQRLRLADVATALLGNVLIVLPQHLAHNTVQRSQELEQFLALARQITLIDKINLLKSSQFLCFARCPASFAGCLARAEWQGFLPERAQAESGCDGAR